MLLSIVILSYNRPKQLERILNNLEGLNSSDVNVIIKDDLSPKIDEIQEIFEKYKKSLGIELSLHVNEDNLGYDSNLLDAFSVSSSEYVFLLSDDDYIKSNMILSTIKYIKETRFDFYFCPYDNNGYTCRDVCEEKNIDFDEVELSTLVYNSILFSGLTYRRDAVVKLLKDEVFLATCIYTQIYLSLNLIVESKSFGILPKELLFLGGDGDNFFGKNQSATDIEVLSDRENILSNLRYQQFLRRVVDRLVVDLDEPISTNLKKSFYKEYNKRLLSYGLKCRTIGYSTFIEFKRQLKGIGYRMPYKVRTLMSVIVLFPSFICSNFYKFGLKYLKKSG
jgi:glycosyltransferase involved in cell wall biosynthesis